MIVLFHLVTNIANILRFKCELLTVGLKGKLIEFSDDSFDFIYRDFLTVISIWCRRIKININAYANGISSVSPSFAACFSAYFFPPTFEYFSSFQQLINSKFTLHRSFCLHMRVVKIYNNLHFWWVASNRGWSIFAMLPPICVRTNVDGIDWHKSIYLLYVYKARTQNVRFTCAYLCLTACVLICGHIELMCVHTHSSMNNWTGNWMKRN